MNPIDEFYFLKNNVVSSNSSNLSQLYLPIIGLEACALYNYLLAFFDNGVQGHKFSEILNHTQFSMPELKQSLDILSAMQLIEFYSISKGYLIKLLPTCSREQFLGIPVFKTLLEQKIGQVAVSELISHVPKNAQNLSKKLSDIFSEVGDIKVSTANDQLFDLEHFKLLMSKNGLCFNHEQDDAMAVTYFAEKYDLNWFATFKIAQETAVDGKISIERMNALRESQALGSPDDFTPKEQIIIREAKQNTALDFLIKIKKSKKAVVTRNEENILKKIAEMGFLDEVINIMTLYTLNKTDSANLNQSYIIKIANDFSYRNIVTAELAMKQMRTNKPVTTKKKQRSNVPSWSEKEYKKTATPEEKAKLEALKKSLLED